MNTILRKQFLAHVGQTSPEPMMIEVARAEGVFFYTLKANTTTIWWRAFRSATSAMPIPAW